MNDVADWKKVLSRAKPYIKLSLFAVVAVCVVYTVWKAFREFDENQFQISQIRPFWLLAAGVCYLGGLSPCWLFWHRTLLAMKQKPRLFDSFRAFFISHLGKYVPGKALVVVLRTSWIRGKNVDTAVAATSVFVETLTMMAVGAAVSAAILAVFFHEQKWFVALGVCLMCGAGIPTLPPIFKRIVRLLQVKRANQEIDSAVNGVNFPLMATGWVSISGGWILLGVSLFCVLKSLPGLDVSIKLLPLLTACVSLSMVAGFLSMLPGGVGVRDLVIISLLGEIGQTGEVNAVIAAILLRLTWLMSEVLISVILYMSSRRNIRTDGKRPT